MRCLQVASGGSGLDAPAIVVRAVLEVDGQQLHVGLGLGPGVRLGVQVTVRAVAGACAVGLRTGGGGERRGGGRLEAQDVVLLQVVVAEHHRRDVRRERLSAHNSHQIRSDQRAALT